MNLYIIRNKALASAIAFITNYKYTVLDDKYISGKKVYAFENNEIIQRAMIQVTNLKKEYENN